MRHPDNQPQLIPGRCVSFFSEKKRVDTETKDICVDAD
jgi:hypothetical protein